jgi:hypothetical protein
MKKIVILVLFLVLIAFLVIILMEPSIEKFDTNNICGFNPEGITKLACVDRCHSQRRLQSISSLGNNYLEKCQSIHCEQICENCNNETCEWKKEVNLSTPLESKISGIVGNGEIKIIWLPPLSRPPITGYTLVIENAKLTNSTRLNFHSDPKCTMCEHIIKGLINGEDYNIHLISSNNMGSSPKSNTLGPLKPLAIKSDFNDSSNKDDDESHWSEEVLNYKETDTDKNFGVRQNDYDELKNLLK